MSRKTIAFQVPARSTARSPAINAASREPSVAPKIIEAEHWVSRTEPPVEVARETPTAAPRAATVTLTISAEPEWVEAVWLGLLLPPAVFWLWGLSAAQKNLRLFAR